VDATETKAATTLTAAELRERLAEHRVTLRVFAKAAGIPASHMSDIVRGMPIGPVRRARIERAIAELKLTEPASPPVFRVHDTE
jgi:predicted transcriptional regulator